MIVIEKLSTRYLQPLTENTKNTVFTSIQSNVVYNINIQHKCLNVITIFPSPAAFHIEFLILRVFLVHTSTYDFLAVCNFCLKNLTCMLASTVKLKIT